MEILKKDYNVVTIFWPVRDAVEIAEVEFSYDFCRSQTRAQLMDEFSGLAWVDYSPSFTIGDALSQTCGELIFIIDDPEIVISPHALSALIEACGEHELCGPVYNTTAFEHQLAQLPSVYLNLSGYLEVSELMAKGDRDVFPVSGCLDPAAILYRKTVLENLDREMPLAKAGTCKALFSEKTGAVSRTSFIHSFGDYYGAEREDLIELVPMNAEKILDVGCAMGFYGKRLKAMRGNIDLTGVEMNPVMAKMAQAHYDRVLNMKIEDADLNADFDLINCGDLIEHLYDPWDMVRRLAGLLKPGGYLVTSIPNAGHWTIAKDLLKGRFQYIPVGLICMSHIRWFTEESVRKLLEDAGFEIEIFRRQVFEPTPEGAKFIDEMCRLGYGNEDSLRTNEFIIRGQLQ